MSSVGTSSVRIAWADCPPLFADRLMALLTAPDRRALGLHHVNQLLLDADRLCHPHWLRPLRWGLLYHCAVHDPLATPEANQEASAELWLEHFAALHETVRGLSQQWEEQVAEAIRACAMPFDRPEHFPPWQHALLDLTLGWLGDAEIFHDAESMMRRGAFRSAGGGDAAWFASWSAFAKQALASPCIYRLIHRDREAQARANLSRGRA